MSNDFLCAHSRNRSLGKHITNLDGKIQRNVSTFQIENYPDFLMNTARYNM